MKKSCYDTAYMRGMNFNISLFFKINALVGKNRFWDAFGRSGAEWVVLAIFGWIVSTICIVFLPDYQAVAVYIGVFCGAFGVSWVLNRFIGYIVKQPRPYVVYSQTKVLLEPRPIFSNKTFPSDHVTIAFLAFFLAVFLNLPWSYNLLPLALWVAWGRVYAGVHYPIDVVGGSCMALGIALVCKFFVFPILF